MATDPPSRSPVEREQTFISHLIELRARLLRCILCVALFFLILGYFANDIYRLVAAPALEHLRGVNAMIATEVGSAFFAPLKLAFYLSLYAAMPYILYQVWAFIAPGLYDNERRFALPLLISSILLFYAGILGAVCHTALVRVGLAQRPPMPTEESPTLEWSLYLFPLLALLASAVTIYAMTGRP